MTGEVVGQVLDGLHYVPEWKQLLKTMKLALMLEASTCDVEEFGGNLTDKSDLNYQWAPLTRLETISCHFEYAKL